MRIKKVDSRVYLAIAASLTHPRRNLSITRQDRMKPQGRMLGSGRLFYKVLDQTVYREGCPERTATVVGEFRRLSLHMPMSNLSIVCEDVIEILHDDPSRPFSSEGDLGVKVRRTKDDKVVGFIIAGDHERTILAPAYPPRPA